MDLVAKMMEKGENISIEGDIIPILKKYLDEGKEGYEDPIKVAGQITFPGIYYTEKGNPIVLDPIAIISGVGNTSDPSTEIIGNGEWSDEKGINTPKLAEGMTPVVYNSSKTSPANNLPAYWDKAQNENEWYDYVAQTDGTDGTSKWANAVTEDGSFWVWIPRYEYKIDSTGATGDYGTKGTGGTIDVRFIKTSTKSGTTGYATDGDGIVRSSDSYIIHPSFTNNVNQGGWDKEIAGIWVAKYEMSMETNNVATTTTDASSGDIATSSIVKVVSKPRSIKLDIYQYSKYV